MIIRRVLKTNYTIIANAPMNDERLSAECLGVLCYLRSRPDNWEVIADQLAKRFGCGKDRMYRILKELIGAGYIVRRAVRNDKTQAWDGVEYLVYDEAEQPRPENPDAADAPRPAPPPPGNPQAEKPDALIRTDLLTNTERQKEPKQTPSKASDWPADFEEQFWNGSGGVWRKVGRGQAERALRAVKNAGKTPFSVVMAGRDRYRLEVADKDPRFVKHPATWLNGKCWEDEPPPDGPKGGSFADIRRDFGNRDNG